MYGSISVSGDEDKDWKQEAMERLPATLERLQDSGYALKDIAILVRTNQEGALVADTLLAYKEEHPSDRYNYDIISDDALFVGSSPAVRFLIAVLRYLRNPEDRTNRKLAMYAYQVLTGKFGESEADESVFQNLQSISRQSLYEVTEGSSVTSPLTSRKRNRYSCKPFWIWFPSTPKKKVRI